MKLKVLVVDLDVSPRAKKWALRVGVPIAMLLGGGAIAYASGLVTWSDGNTLHASDLNGNFAYLQSEITSLQGTVTVDGGAPALVPPGTIEAYAGIITGNPSEAPAHPPPAGWLLCNGDQLNGLTPSYQALYAAIGTNYGGNAGSDAFNLPDLRGQFLRGVDDGVGRDPESATRTSMNTGGNGGDAVGSVQGSMYASHTHSITEPPGGHNHGIIGGSFVTSSSTCPGYVGIQAVGSNGYSTCPSTAAALTGITGTNSSGNSAETRPINAYVNYIIKY